jgi:hypothetical protein
VPATSLPNRLWEMSKVTGDAMVERSDGDSEYRDTGPRPRASLDAAGPKTASNRQVGQPAPGSFEERRSHVRALYEAKTCEELRQADALAPGSDVVGSSGELLCQVALVKGLPGPAEKAGGAALSGPDGAAADAAVEALGYDPDATFRMLSRPESSLDPGRRTSRLRRALEAVDPLVVIALDADAAADIQDAFELTRLVFGRPIRVGGRLIVAVDGLEASLADAARKRRVWRQMQAVRAK